MDFIFEVVLMVLLSYPGALIRWLFFRKNRTLKELINDEDPNINVNTAIISILIITMIIFLIQFLDKYIS